MDISVKERLLSWIEKNKLSISAVAIKSGIGDGKIRKADNLSADTLCAILKAYPEISAEWLMRGTDTTTINVTQNNNEGVNLNSSTAANITLGKFDSKELDDIIGDYKERIEEYKERVTELKETIELLKSKQ